MFIRHSRNSRFINLLIQNTWLFKIQNEIHPNNMTYTSIYQVIFNLKCWSEYKNTKDETPGVYSLIVEMVNYAIFKKKKVMKEGKTETAALYIIPLLIHVTQMSPMPLNPMYTMSQHYSCAD